MARSNGNAKKSHLLPKPVTWSGSRDVMSVAQRSALMSRIRSSGTWPERRLIELLRAEGLTFCVHGKHLAGSPDIYFPRQRVAVFVDGDFWHGWRFPAWRHRLAPYWSAKIARNRARDSCSHRRLGRAGWKVIRIWEHQLERDADGCVLRVLTSMKANRGGVTARGKKGGSS